MPVHALDGYYLGLTAIITVAYQLAFFAVAFACHIDRLTDFAGGTNFIVIAVVTLLLGSRSPAEVPPARQLVATALLAVWALRLAGFLFYRILRSGTDSRFDGTRDRFFPFLGFWVAQMVWVWTTALPVTVLNSAAVQGAARQSLPAFGTVRDIAGVAMFGIGFVSEAVADYQGFAFREQRRKQPTAVGQLAYNGKGLYAWSRHPNYFGEILLQFGIYTLASSDAMVHPRPSFAPALNATVVGPAVVTVLLFFFSGMNLSERPGAAKRYVEPHGPDDDARRLWVHFQDYLRRTSIIIPLPPALYAPLPTWIKRTLLLEFPIYVFDPAKHRKSDVASEASPKPRSSSSSQPDSDTV